MMNPDDNRCGFIQQSRGDGQIKQFGIATLANETDRIKRPIKLCQNMLGPGQLSRTGFPSLGPAFTASTDSSSDGWLALLVVVFASAGAPTLLAARMSGRPLKLSNHTHTIA